MKQSNVPHKKQYLLGILLAVLMLALASLACDLEQSMGQLTIGESRTVEVTAGWEYDWNVQVIPGKSYKVTLAMADANTPPIYSIVDVTTGVLCDECVQSADGYITINGLSVTFIAPENGKARITVYVREGAGKCTIQVHKVS